MEPLSAYTRLGRVERQLRTRHEEKHQVPVSNKSETPTVYSSGPHIQSPVLARIGPCPSRVSCTGAGRMLLVGSFVRNSSCVGRNTARLALSEPCPSPVVSDYLVAVQVEKGGAVGHVDRRCGVLGLILWPQSTRRPKRFAPRAALSERRPGKFGRYLSIPSIL